MNNSTTDKIKKKLIIFHTGVGLLVDRKIGSINLLSNEQIMYEKTKIKNMRNGKIRS